MKPLFKMLSAAALLTACAWAQALTIQPYSAQALTGAQQAGKPVAVHFHADWCPTCKQQEKAFSQIKDEPGLDMLLLVADYDKEKDLRKSMKVRSQSTVVVFRGADEKARSGGDVTVDKLRAALKAAL